MPPRPIFLDDTLESIIRKCIIFPADGSETRLTNMTVRTTTDDDTSEMKRYSRCVDMVSTFGVDNRKTRIVELESTSKRRYLFYYNMAPNLPINLNIARSIGVTSSDLKPRRRLFWRGDVVGQLVESESEMLSFMVNTLDADLSELESFGRAFRRFYQEGYLEKQRRFDEALWGYYESQIGPSISTPLSRPSTFFWGPNAVEREKESFNGLDELRPIPQLVYKKLNSFTEQIYGLFSSVKSTFNNSTQRVPMFPPELERRIFEMCAIENPETCTVLVRVAKRVNFWIDPILIETVSFVEETSIDLKLDLFLSKLLTGGKSTEYYAEHVKNLAIIGRNLGKDEVINRILAICSGVESLVIWMPAKNSFTFFHDPQAGHSLRRLALDLRSFTYQPLDYSNLTRPTFSHNCFSNLTHLHLADFNSYDFGVTFYLFTGWENFASLTHLALYSAGVPEQTIPFIQKLPAIQYVAVGRYYIGEEYRYFTTTVEDDPAFRTRWGDRIVFLSAISTYDWEYGARGGGDFWDIVEREVERRLALKSRG